MNPTFLPGLWVLSALIALVALDARATDAGVGALPSVAPASTAASAAPSSPPAFVPADVKPLPDLRPRASAGVLIIPIHDTIDLGLAPYVRRALAAHPEPAAIIFDVDTFGGRVDAAVRIRDTLLGLKVPSIAYVNRRAISAGALISLAAEHIVVTSGATIGAATPVQLEGGEAKPVEEKMVSYMRSEMRSTAEARGRSGVVAEAMVDADTAIPGVDEKGKLLTLTTETALSTHIADARHDTLESLLAALGLEDAPRLSVEANWAEGVARFLTDPTVSGLLMGIGMLGLLIEFTHPGVILPGAVGAVCLALFFGGHWVVELAGWEEILLFVVGLILLLVEIFVIPGFGLAGIGGIVMVVLALSLALVGLPLGASWDLGLIADALGVVTVSTFAAVVLFLVALRYLPERKFARRLVLETTLGPLAGESPGKEDWHASPSSWSHWVGRAGIAETDLRLSGKARFGEETLDVVSRTEYIDRGTPVRVVEVEGIRIVVMRNTSVESGGA
jgi:membrane-bound serine protease (ClpP class)